MANVQLLQRAEADLVTIAKFITAQFGPVQALAYRDGLLSTFDALAKHPLMGADQGHIRPNLRRHTYKSHTIDYRPSRNGITIQRILGPGQDPLCHL